MVKQASGMSKRWKITRLGEVTDIQTGPFGSQLHNEDYVQIGTPIITVENLINDSIKYTKETPKVSDEDKIRLCKYSLQKGDIVFSRVGSVDRCAYVSQNENGWLFSGRLLRVRPKSILSDKYAFYWITQESIKEFVRKIAVGATMPSINTELLSQVPISFPPLDEQRAIAAVLSSLDNKIELLREQNKTLEATAQAIYREWILKFNFFGASGKMIASPLGEIPEGWRVGYLTDVFDFMEGPGIRNWQYTESGRRFINIRLIQDGDINIKGANFVSEEEAESAYKHFHLQERDMVVSTSGTLGRSAIVRKEHLPLILNTSVIRFRPIDKISYGFMYQFLQSRFFQSELESLASGSVQLNFGPVHLKQIEMIIPSKAILKLFAEVVNPLYKKISFNLSQAQTLSSLRDILLPKLMRGEVRAKGFGG